MWGLMITMQSELSPMQSAYSQLTLKLGGFVKRGYFMLNIIITYRRRKDGKRNDAIFDDTIIACGRMSV